ncbi:MAG: glycosyl hydrolase-related protein [Enterocloster clostridioformis]
MAGSKDRGNGLWPEFAPGIRTGARQRTRRILEQGIRGPAVLFCGNDEKAEDGNGYILRIYENRNTRTSMTVNLGFEISHVEECDLLERTLRSIETDGHRFKDFIKPYGD